MWSHAKTMAQYQRMVVVDDVCEMSKVQRRSRQGEMKRIQRKRTKGWRMPPNTIYVGRPSRWGNPVKIVDVSDELTYPDEKAWRVYSETGSIVSDDYVSTIEEARHDATEWYREAIAHFVMLYDPDFYVPLQGKNLACWCPLDQPCHADVLIEMVEAKEK